MGIGQEYRIRQILDDLHDGGTVSVQGLADRLKVSPMTVRRDLSDLETRGYLVRTHGGAVKSPVVDTLFSFDRRLHRNENAKESICRLAAEFVSDNDTVFIDCGTTLFRLCSHIRGRRNVRVVTNSLPVVAELADDTSMRVTLIGGDLVHERKALYGSAAGAMIEGVHAHKAFIGADGVSVSGGLSSYDEQEGAISAGMAARSDEVFLLIDSSKLERSSYHRFGDLSIVDHLITDSEVDRDMAGVYACMLKGVHIAEGVSSAERYVSRNSGNETTTNGGNHG